MSVTIRPYVNGGWEADIRVALPDGGHPTKRIYGVTFSARASTILQRSRARR
jgi:hypothetical protein